MLRRSIKTASPETELNTISQALLDALALAKSEYVVPHGLFVLRLLSGRLLVDCRQSLARLELFANATPRSSLDS